MRPNGGIPISGQASTRSGPRNGGWRFLGVSLGSRRQNLQENTHVYPNLRR
jgi:hypothetical protein